MELPETFDPVAFLRTLFFKEIEWMNADYVVNYDLLKKIMEYVEDKKDGKCGSEAD